MIILGGGGRRKFERIWINRACIAVEFFSIEIEINPVFVAEDSINIKIKLNFQRVGLSLYT